MLYENLRGRVEERVTVTEAELNFAQGQESPDDSVSEFALPRAEVVAETIAAFQRTHSAVPDAVLGAFVRHLSSRTTDKVLFGQWEQPGGCQCPGLASGLDQHQEGVSTLAIAFDDHIMALIEAKGYGYFPDGRLYLLDD